MDPKAVVRFLLKAIVLLPLLLLGWSELSIVHYYHAAVGTVANALYHTTDAIGVVRSVAADGAEFAVRIVVGGERSVMRVVAADITSNECTLLALYLASPIRPLSRVYLIGLAGSIVALFVVHVLTFVASIQAGIITHPAFQGTPDRWTRICGVYQEFYLHVGMYLVVLVLWLPYVIMWLKHSPSRHNH